MAVEKVYEELSKVLTKAGGAIPVIPNKDERTITYLIQLLRTKIEEHFNTFVERLASEMALFFYDGPIFCIGPGHPGTFQYRAKLNPRHWE